MKIFCKGGKHRLFLFGMILIALMVAEPMLFSRAGGGGGGGRSGGGGYSGGGSSSSSSFRGGSGAAGFDIWDLVFFTVGISFIGLIFLYQESKKRRRFKVLPSENGGSWAQRGPDYRNFITANPDFDEEAFKEKVKGAFIKIQEAWEVQDLSSVRRFISDGVYRRFNTQFRMMQILDQKNTLERLDVEAVWIDSAESDGEFDVLHVAVKAYVVDHFISSKYEGLNSGGRETFVEYWSFIRKGGGEKRDIYAGMNCPQCGAELPAEAGETAQCRFCRTIINSGAYDWVLSEITQADDFAHHTDLHAYDSKLYNFVKYSGNIGSDFAVQLLEDKVSNGYLQVLTAITLKKPEMMRRFVSDEAFQKLKRRIKKSSVVYNRLYLNDVSLIGAVVNDSHHTLALSVTFSCQRVKLDDEKARLLDKMITTSTEIVIVTRKKGAGIPKGSLYAHSCPACAGPLEDTIDLNCPACSSLLNSAEHEWIIEDIIKKGEYKSYLAGKRREKSYGIKPELLDSLYSVREYAFNNMLLIMAADGTFGEDEQIMAEKIARKWGYSVSRIKPLFKMAKSGRLSLRMPSDQALAKKVYSLMEKAAMADGFIFDEERELLDEVKGKYLYF